MGSTLAGEYYLEGMREMASGFLLRTDGTFQFFFTYGAMDRFGSGTWTRNNGQLVLNSRPKPPYDFALVESKRHEHDFISIMMESENPVLLRYVYCSLEKGAEGSWKQLSQYGIVQFPKKEVDTVSLILEFCPERFSTIPVSHPEHNEFTFRFEQTIMEVFFENFSIQVEAERLTGRHPLMEGDDFRYGKR
ncbi:MAG: hypothetical protein ABI688_10590 [Bacteroidota bacterium]